MSQPPRSKNDILITGTGRSGTTLACHLLNKLPNTVALSEPMRVGKFSELGGYAEMRQEIQRFCEKQRGSIHKRGVAFSKNAGGAVPDNPFGTAVTDAGLRSARVSKGKISVDKELSKDFTLIIKHISAFAALLGELVNHFPVYAVVRNPLPVLASWNSIDFNLQRGHVPAAERITPALQETLAGIDDALDRQLHVLAWFHGQFRRYLPDESIIPYESIVESGGAALGVIRPEAEQLAEPLKSRNASELYERESLARIGERLLRSEGAHWKTYTKESVEELLQATSGAC